MSNSTRLSLSCHSAFDWFMMSSNDEFPTSVSAFLACLICGHKRDSDANIDLLWLVGEREERTGLVIGGPPIRLIERLRCVCPRRFRVQAETR